MGSANKYGNSFMLTDNERQSIIDLLINLLKNLSVPMEDEKIKEFASKCVSHLYVIYSKNNKFLTIHEQYRKEVGKLAAENNIAQHTKKIIKTSYLGICSLLVTSKEYDADGATRIGKDNLNIYFGK